MTKKTDTTKSDSKSTNKKDHIDLGKDARVEVDAFEGKSQFNQVDEAHEKAPDASRGRVAGEGKSSESRSRTTERNADGSTVEPLSLSGKNKSSDDSSEELAQFRKAHSEVPSNATTYENEKAADELEFIEGIGYVFRTQKQGVQAQKDARNAFEKHQASLGKDQANSEEE